MEIKDKYGHSYNFYERKENTSSSKKFETHQRMRQPIQIQKNQKKFKFQIQLSIQKQNVGKNIIMK